MKFGITTGKRIGTIGTAMLALVLSLGIGACSEDDDLTGPDEEVRPEFGATVEGTEQVMPATSITAVYDDVTKKVLISGELPSDDPLNVPERILQVSFTVDVDAIDYPHTITESESPFMVYRETTPNDTVTWTCTDMANCNITLTELEGRSLSGFFSGNYESTADVSDKTITDGTFSVNL